MILAYGLYILIMGLIVISAWIMPLVMPANIPFGVRVPPNHLNEPVIAQARRNYGIGMVLIVLIALAGAWLLPIFVAISGGAFVILVLEVVNFLLARGQIRQVKAREEWYAGQRQALAADTQPQERERLPRVWLGANYVVLALLIVTAIIRYPALPERVPIHFDLYGTPNQWGDRLTAIVSLPLTALFLTLLIHILTRVFLTTHPRLDPADPERSRARWLQQQQVWGEALLAIGVVSNLTLFMVALTIWQVLPSGSTVMALALLLPLAGLVAIVVLAILRTVRINQRFAIQPGETGYVQRDDDRYWKGGMIYVNHDDPAIFVPKRFGIGLTINFGNPVGLLVMLLLIGVPLLISLVSLLLTKR